MLRLSTLNHQLSTSLNGHVNEIIGKFGGPDQLLAAVIRTLREGAAVQPATDVAGNLNGL